MKPKMAPFALVCLLTKESKAYGGFFADHYGWMNQVCLS